jgi:hypothetical protein
VKDTERLASTLHEAFHVARRGRPGPVLVDIPKDVQFAHRHYAPREEHVSPATQPRRRPDPAMVEALVAAIETAERPVFYTGGGVVNSGPEASRLLRELARPPAFRHLHADGPGRYRRRALVRDAGDATAPTRPTWRGNELRRDDQNRRALDDRITGASTPSRRLAQGAHRHRPSYDQQGRSGWRSHRRRRGRRAAGVWTLGPRGRQDQARGWRWRRQIAVARREVPRLPLLDKTIKPQYSLDG